MTTATSGEAAAAADEEVTTTATATKITISAPPPGQPLKRDSMESVTGLSPRNSKKPRASDHKGMKRNFVDRER